MSTANEVSFVDTVHRTNLDTLRTTGTERIINRSKIVNHLDSSARTSLFAFHTAYASVGAGLTCLSTLIVIGALYDNARGIVYKMDDGVGTLTHAYTASDTLTGVDTRYAVLDRNGVLRTNHGTITVSKTSKGTELVTAIRHIGVTAGLLALIIVFSLRCVAGAVTSNVRNLLYDVNGLNAKNT